ncbi:MAG: hypothetical protein WDO71_15565 [Bacteroidota bacterium]
MNMQLQHKVILVLSLVLGLLIIVVNGAGLLFPDVLYARETTNWYAQSVGQDIADLFFALPVLVISSLLAYRQDKKALLVWAGTLVYLIYTFLIYCFAIHFNQLFVLYCIILGLSVYLFLWFILTQYGEPVNSWFRKEIPVRLFGFFMIAIGILFYTLWLMPVIPAIISNTTPRELTDAGLFTNPVHVLDLSVCLPGIIITGILLLKRHPVGLLMTPVVLTFFVIMDISLATLMVVMRSKGVASNPVVMIFMFALTILSLAMLIIYLRSMKKEI